jgi:hypothetical protein
MRENELPQPKINLKTGNLYWIAMKASLDKRTRQFVLDRIDDTLILQVMNAIEWNINAYINHRQI